MRFRAPELLTDHHVVEDFDSGVPSLDDWLKARALANQESGASRTFVLCDEENVVAAYYALASSSVAHIDAPSKLRRNMPDPIPVVTLGRLAVDRRFQRQKIGRDMMRDASLRVIAAAEQIGVRAMLVHAINDAARAFYLEVGFRPSPTNEMTLMVPLSTLRDSL